MVNDDANIDEPSLKIIDVKYNKVAEDEKKYGPTMFLHAMTERHIYSEKPTLSLAALIDEGNPKD
jgi:hypothetical protein